MSEPRGFSSRQLWVLLSLVAPVFFGAFAVYPGLFVVMGVNHYGVWFLDTFALLASNDAVTRGLDPLALNPLDYFQRPHVYSHWWLHLSDLGLTRADITWIGLTLVGTFLVAALTRLRPQSVGQFFWYLAVLCSAPVLLAVERGNNDLVIFILLAPLVPCLLSTRSPVRLIAPVLVAAATMLKYYPAVAGLALLATAESREMRHRLMCALLLVGMAIVSVLPDLRILSTLVPKPEGLLSFGAVGFFNVLGWTGFVPKLVCLLAGILAVVIFWRRRCLGDWEPVSAQQADWLHFILGAALLTGCFFAERNFGYRWIYAVWLAPLLWMLPTDPSVPELGRRVARWARWLLLVVLWWDPFCCFILNRLTNVLSGPTMARLAKASFLLEQPIDWALFLLLLLFLTHFTQRQLRRLVGKSRPSS